VVPTLPTLAIAALLVGGAAVLTTVATSPDALRALDPSGAGAARQGTLVVLVDNTADPAEVRMTVRGPSGDLAYDEVVPRSGTWEHALALAPEVYTVRLTFASGHVSQDGDLRLCPDGKATSRMTVTVEPLRVRFAGGGVRCDDGTPADVEREGSHDAAAPFRFEGRATIPLGTKGLPSPMCPDAGCSATYLSGRIGFVLDAPAMLRVRADWAPATPLSERLHVSLDLDQGDGTATGVAWEEGASGVTFETFAPEAGQYWVLAWPTGDPAGAAAAQEVHFRVDGIVEG
jgi:hypothetical protein